MSQPNLSELPALLQRTADLLRLAGESDFKASAYEKAATVVESEGENLRVRTSETELKKLPSIGTSLAREIAAFLDSGALPALRELEEQLPHELVEWLDISGLGPKRAAKIHQALHITHLHELREALQDGRVAELPGFGAKSAQKLLDALQWRDEHADRCRLDQALALADTVAERLSKLKGLQRLETAGSLRRRLETVGDLDFLAVCDDPAALHRAFRDMPVVREILVSGDTKTSVRSESGRQIDLRTVAQQEFPAACLYFTGSKEHNVFLRGRAREKNMTLNEYGLFPLKNGEPDRKHPVKADSEEALYRTLDLPPTPPELRESPYEPWIEHNDLPDLVTADDLRGVLHAHSSWSDGVNSIQEMAHAARDLGFHWIGISDHSRTAAYAGGLSIKDVKKQWREIDNLNARFRDHGIDFTVYKGIESDILPDGSLDYPDDLLEGFDFVIASLHGQLNQNAEAMQERVEKALHHPSLTLLGHPTARLLLRREGVKLNMEVLIRLAAKQDVGIELNCTPERMELDWRWGRLAREVNLRSAICPDAHSTGGLQLTTQYGLPLARKAGFSANRLLNCANGL